jgi:hypothetical protein
MPDSCIFRPVGFYLHRNHVLQAHGSLSVNHGHLSSYSPTPAPYPSFFLFRSAIGFLWHDSGASHLILELIHIQQGRGILRSGVSLLESERLSWKETEKGVFRFKHPILQMRELRSSIT